MRVLSARVALVAIALVAIAGPGCYAPALDDCQFACGPDDACPGGTTCIDGYCRSQATGTCELAAAVDSGSPPAIDAALACPASPCDGVPVAVGDHCAVLCAASSFTAARGACTGPWRLAIVDSDAARTALAAALPGQRGWVGLMKTNGGASGWQWLTTPARDQPTDAAAHPPWAAAQPSAVALYGILDATGPSPLLSTSAGPEPAFCETAP